MLHTFEWDSIYLLPRKVTIESRTRDFQNKILNRILFTNKMLFKMKISDTDKCTFCNEEEETIEHLPANTHYLSGKKSLNGLKRTIFLRIWMN